MNPVKIEGDAFPLGKPANWNPAESGHCSTLWVRLDMDGDLPFLRSAWEVGADEAGWLLAGAKMQLGICGQSHPVVQLGLGPIPEDFEPPYIVQPIVTTEGVRAVRVTTYLPCAQRVFAEASIGDDGMGPAVALAIREIEAFVSAHLMREEGNGPGR